MKPSDALLALEKIGNVPAHGEIRNAREIRARLDRAIKTKAFQTLWFIKDLAYLLELVAIMEREIKILEESLTQYRHLSPNDIPDPRHRMSFSDASWSILKARELREWRK
jgi:hypothetical protein